MTSLEEQTVREPIIWFLHLRSSPEAVYEMLATDVKLTDENVAPEDYCEVLAGWVSVLMALKAAVDFGVDLRNHDPERSYSQGYADN